LLFGNKLALFISAEHYLENEHCEISKSLLADRRQSLYKNINDFKIDGLFLYLNISPDLIRDK